MSINNNDSVKFIEDYIKNSNSFDKNLLKFDLLDDDYKNCYLDKVKNNGQFGSDIKSIKLLRCGPYSVDKVEHYEQLLMIVQYGKGIKKLVLVPDIDKKMVEYNFRSLKPDSAPLYKANKVAHKTIGGKQLETQWVKQTVSMVYQGPHYEYYNRLHSKIQNEIIEIASSSKQNNFLVIDAGCGSGEFLKNFSLKELPKEKNLKLVGFDFNEGNILDCKKNYSGNTEFMVGNIFNLKNIVSELQLKYKPDVTILVFSGSMTANVLPNVLDGIRVLKDLGPVNYIMGGGAEKPLFNFHILKQNGLVPIKGECEEGNECNFFSYQVKEFKEVAKQRKNKFESNGRLDLTYNSNPDLLFKEIGVKIKDKTIIDLSLSELNEGIKKILEQEVSGKKGVKLIFYHYDLGQIVSFLKFCNGLKDVEVEYEYLIQEEYENRSTKLVIGGHSLLEKIRRRSEDTNLMKKFIEFKVSRYSFDEIFKLHCILNPEFSKKISNEEFISLLESSENKFIGASFIGDYIWYENYYSLVLREFFWKKMKISNLDLIKFNNSFIDVEDGNYEEVRNEKYKEKISDGFFLLDKFLSHLKSDTVNDDIQKIDQLFDCCLCPSRITYSDPYGSEFKQKDLASFEDTIKLLKILCEHEIISPKEALQFARLSPSNKLSLEDLEKRFAD